MSSPPQWEASFSSQTFSASPQSLLPASPHKDLQPVAQQGWSCSRCWRDGGDRAGHAGLGLASRLKTCLENKIAVSPHCLLLLHQEGFFTPGAESGLPHQLAVLEPGLHLSQKGMALGQLWRGKAGSQTDLGTLRTDQDPGALPG